VSAPVPLIYVHDDDEVFRRAMTRLLSAALPCNVVTFGDATTAIQRAVAAPPDLFITDMFHVGPRGDEIVRVLRRSATARRVPIWIVSGAVSRERALIEAAGADAVAEKPLGSKQLLALLSEFFGKRKVSPLDFDAEAPDLDIKLRPSIGTRDGCARLAKDVIALANSGGGHIVFGKDDDGKGGFAWLGLSDSDLEELEVSRLNRALANFIEPPHHVVPKRVIRGGAHFVEVHVPAATDLLMAARQNDNAGLHRGRIYVRTVSAESAEAQTSHDVRSIVDRLVALRQARR
jgi:CheY-like chemotaxis protein